MIVVSGEIAVDPDQHEALLELAAAVEPPSVAEDGCVAYQFWVHRTERGVVHVFEKWNDAEAIATHGATEHFKTFFRGLKALGIRRVEIEQFEASPIG